VSNLQQEIKKKHPFDSLAQEVVLNLLRTNDRIQIHFDRLFRENGLQSGSQYNVLRILRGEGQPMRTREIAERTITEVPGLTGLLDRLEHRGLVARKRYPEDRRVIFVSITEKGQQFLTEIEAPLMALHDQIVRHMTEDELTQLNALLEKARQNCSNLKK
jgi:DNA-binding MarR family transcriptional regulator